MDSLNYLQEKLSHLQQKYPHRSRYCALRMVITSIHALFMCYNKNVHPVSVNLKFHKNKCTEPIIVFSVKGGLGDFLIACNYIFNFYKYADDITFKLKVCYHSPELLDAFCSDLPGVIELGMNINKMQGNLKIELNRFPRFLSGDMAYFARRSKKLERVFSAWHNFYIHNRKFFDFMPQIDGISNEYALILGSKRINQADIGGILQMDEEYKAPLFYPSPNEEKRILEQFGLCNYEFITACRGQSTISNALSNTKLWSPERYNELLEMLKDTYPSLKLVQLGVNRIGFDCKFNPIDVDLLGKTNLTEIKVILKHAKLHIDSEGGLVHLRHALQGGPSVVLFGPTSPQTYGYKENLNLRSNSCPQPCEWITDDWLERCARRTDKNICMKQLTPSIVFDEINKNHLI